MKIEHKITETTVFPVSIEKSFKSSKNKFNINKITNTFKKMISNSLNESNCYFKGSVKWFGIVFCASLFAAASHDIKNLSHEDLIFYNKLVLDTCKYGCLILLPIMFLNDHKNQDQAVISGRKITPILPVPCQKMKQKCEIRARSNSF